MLNARQYACCERDRSTCADGEKSEANRASLARLQMSREEEADAYTQYYPRPRY